MFEKENPSELRDKNNNDYDNNNGNLYESFIIHSSVHDSKDDDDKDNE